MFPEHAGHLFNGQRGVCVSEEDDCREVLSERVVWVRGGKCRLFLSLQNDICSSRRRLTAERSVRILGQAGRWWRNNPGRWDGNVFEKGV
jgi:hypothetical protein